jgi:hypothetical protein
MSREYITWLLGHVLKDQCGFSEISQVEIDPAESILEMLVLQASREISRGVLSIPYLEKQCFNHHNLYRLNTRLFSLL